MTPARAISGLVVPTLSILLKLEPTVCVGTASFYSVLIKIYAVFEHYRLKTIHLGVCIWLLVGALPANILTAHAINHYQQRTLDQPEKLAAFQDHLKVVIVIVMLAAVFMITYQMLKGVQPPPQDPQAAHSPPVRLRARTKRLGVFFGAVIGAVIGSTSISGVIIVPLLILFFGLSAERTVGSAILIAMVLTMATSIIYAKGGQVDYPTGIVMSVGSLAGVFYGSRLSVKMPEKGLRAIVTGLVAVAAILMLLRDSMH